MLLEKVLIQDPCLVLCTLNALSIEHEPHPTLNGNVLEVLKGSIDKSLEIRQVSV